MPEGAKGICQNNQQSFSCGDFVKVDGHDFNIAAWVNTNLIEHDNIQNTSSPKQSDS
ncbi:hypothetical protein [Halogeometricum borinquense]|uniref:hypothetical protein n=1 Tax=Halogeometricum borinquense TaxID=60847 RepID=UPI001A917CCD|nr:hypothetical protein [Halogeometricum borinquense]